MNLSVGTQLHGFTVTRTRDAAELNARLVEMVHDRTGAELCWLDNGERNKLFSVAFQTLPEDSTGVFHILEHSVLCGSKKYPVREPFVELLKSSMQTFLNAMTFPDKTVYPVSSRNEQDFLNLAGVYLDAVFAPRILEDPNIFYQEGWHLALEGDDSAYRGVVFNEMKGAMSNVMEVVQQGMNQLLFPDTCYRFNSGGDPAVILDLTYEQFVETYRRFYHPSNARFYLDGSIPLDRTLALIAASLEGFDRRTDRPRLAMQKPVAGTGTQYYEIAPGEDPSGKTYFAMGRIIGTWEDKVKCLAAQVLCDTLADSNEAPLKKAVLETGLCQDMTLTVSDDVAQPCLLLQITNAADGRTAALRQCVLDTARRLAESGLDREALAASINRLEFQTRQGWEPQGLMRCFQALNSWMYGGDPLTDLTHDEKFKALRAMLDSGGFKALLTELFLDDAGWSALEVLPSATLGDEKRAREAARLNAEKAAWTEEQRAACLRLNERLTLWQQTPDTPEQLATLPILPLSEIGDKPEYAATEEETAAGVTVLRHQAACRGVVHLSLYFPLTDCTLTELTRISFLHELLGKLPTKRHSAAQLHQRVKAVFGDLSFGVQVYGRPEQTRRCTPCLTASASVLESNLPEASELLREILTETCFDEPERIRQTVIQTNESVKMLGIMAGNRIAMLSARSRYTAQGAVQEAAGGWTYAQWLHGFVENFDVEISRYISLVKQVMERTVGRKRLVLSVTAAGAVELEALASAFPEGTAAEPDAAYTAQLPEKQGIRIPAQVGYASQAFRSPQAVHGSLPVAAQLLSLDYLWNVVRVQGGAYGAGMLTDRDGVISTYSYRDPSPGRSLQVYAGLAATLRKFCENGEPLDKYIISAVSKTEPLLSPQDYGRTADRNWFCGITLEDETKLRREMLQTDLPALLSWTGVLEQMAAEGAVCVVGPDGMIHACGADTLEVSDW